MQEIPNFIWDEKKKILLSASLDKGIKMWQLPLSWPSELVRKYKQKNERKILLKNYDALRDINKENEILIQEGKKEEKIFENFEMKNLDENGQDKNTLKNKENVAVYSERENPNDKGNDSNLLNESDLIKKEYDLIEDDDFIIGQKLKKMNELTEKEKNCEDLHGWDEDPQI